MIYPKNLISYASTNVYRLLSTAPSCLTHPTPVPARRPETPRKARR